MSLRWSQQPLAIVGMGVRLPGAPDLDGFWRLLEEGATAVAPLPEELLERDLYYREGTRFSRPGDIASTYSELGAVVEADPRTAAWLAEAEESLAGEDPAHLLFLRTVLDALDHAGIPQSSLGGRMVGIFAGHARVSNRQSDYLYYLSISSLLEAMDLRPTLDPRVLRSVVDRVKRQTRERYPAPPASRIPNLGASGAARLVAAQLGTHGPYCSVDTACGRCRLVPHPTMNTVCRRDTKSSVVFDGAKEAVRVAHGSQQKAVYEVFGQSRRDTRTGQADPYRRFVLRCESSPLAVGELPRSLKTLLVAVAPEASAFSGALEEVGSTSEVALSRDEAMAKLAASSFERLILDSSAWEQRSKESSKGASELFWLVQRWLRGVSDSRAKPRELVMVTRLGGDLGTGPQHEVEAFGGAMSGLAKSLARERTDLRVKVVDVAQGEPVGRIAAAVLAELAAPSSGVASGWIRGQRMQPIALAAEEVAKVDRAAAREKLDEALRADSSWVVTGGARGITSLCASALASRYGVALRLIGTTERDPRAERWSQLDGKGMRELQRVVAATVKERSQDAASAWLRVSRAIELEKSLQGLEELGIDVRYAAADVTSSRDLERALQLLREQSPPIRGLIHGAGIEQSGNFLDKTPEAVASCVDVKVGGLANLVELTADDPVVAVIAFGSVAGTLGGLGQTDYSMASELMAKWIARHRQETGAVATCLAWPPWNAPGMALRPESRLALRAAEIPLLDPELGEELFLRELDLGLTESAVVFGCERLFREARIPGFGKQDEGAEPTVNEPPSELGENAPLLWLRAQHSAETRLDPGHWRVLADHCRDGKPILPAALTIELLAQFALRDAPPGGRFALDQVQIRAPLTLRHSWPLLATLERTVSGNSVLRAPCHDERGNLLEPRQRIATLGGVGRYVAPPLSPRRPEHINLRRATYPEDPGPGEIWWGKSLRSVLVIGDEGTRVWADLEAPRSAQDGSFGSRLSTVLLDGCLFALGVLVANREGVYALPVGADGIYVRRMPLPGEHCSVAGWRQGPEEAASMFDLRLDGEDGDCLLWVRGQRFVRTGEVSEELAKLLSEPAGGQQ